MRVIALGHAGVLIRSESGRTVVIDPWIEEPVFASAWYRYPPPPPPEELIQRRPDALLLSHAHPDHSAERTLRWFDPATEVRIVRFEGERLRRRATAVFGGARVVELEGWREATLAGGAFTVLAIPSDLGWEDASFVVEADGVSVYHGNDNPLARPTYRRIAERRPIDLALLPFAGASSYPTGFEWPDGVVRTRAEEKKEDALGRMRDGIVGLRPRAGAVPFASDWALLEPGLAGRNWADRYRPEEAAARLSGEAVGGEAGATCPIFAWEAGDEWTREGGLERRGRCDAYPRTVEAVRAYGRARGVTDAPAPSPRGEAPGPPAGGPQPAEPAAAREGARGGERVGVRELPADLVAAHIRAALARRLRGPAGGGRESVRGAIEVAWEGGAVHVALDGGGAEVRLGAAADPAERVYVPARDLARILAGELLWEDLWYGYRLRIRKRDGSPYFRVFWEALLELDRALTFAGLDET